MTHVFAGNLGGKPPTKTPDELAREQQQQGGILLRSAPSQMELAQLAALVSQGKTAVDAVAYALELWRESIAALSRTWEEVGIYSYDISIAKFLRDALEVPIKNLPKPDRFPATLDDFLRLIVRGKTPADSTKRMRDYLESRIGYKPGKPTGEFTKGAFTLASIKDADNAGGFFTPDLWRLIGTGYMVWWKRHKSDAARAAARKRKGKSTT
jgi:hypothetical protein